nr:MAG TPA: hypothetical protein [Caudoviricetes sp.]DAJ61196.1 MAG TPA: hypothetical protein [Caudoviricetes sp.]
MTRLATVTSQKYPLVTVVTKISVLPRVTSLFGSLVTD